MTKWWKRSLALSLGVLAGGARAADPAPAVQLERPVIAAAGPRTADVSLHRPVPLTAAGAAVVDKSVRTIGYSNTTDVHDLVIRGQAPDASTPKPLPAGPPDQGSAASSNLTSPPSQSAWRRYTAATSTPGTLAESVPMVGGSAAVVASAGQGFTATPTSPSNPTFAPVPSDSPAIAGPAWSVLHGRFGDLCNNACPADDCDGGCGNCCCSFSDRFYVSGEYLLWWIRGSNTPPLVTRGSAGDPIPGALGLPGTTVLFGGGSVEDNPFSGGRLNLGYWFGDQHLLGIDFGGFFLGQQGKNFTATSTGTPILARPIINAATGTEDTEIVSLPGVLAGSINVHTDSQLWGYEANLRSNLFAGHVCGMDYFVDGIAGFRGLGLDETLDVNEALVVVGGSSAGAQITTSDHFGTQNRFYGGQIGFLSELRWDRWILDLNLKSALGTTQEMVQINGATTITPLGGATHVFPGGLLALPSNSGRFTRDEFSWVPELGLNFGYQCTDHIKLFVGYDILYWTAVVRPGNQIDRVVNTNQLPPPVAGGPARPAFTFNSTDFWAQGVTFGVEFRY
jgi:hypothetical protein